MKARAKPAPAPITWTRADPVQLASFDPRTKICVMNCGPSTLDPRSDAERLLLCDDCLTRPAPTPCTAAGQR